MSEPGSTRDGSSSSSEQNPPIDFTTLVLSLSTSAFMHLGLQPDGSSSGKKNLIMAKQSIDMIAMLEEKTKGNLTGEEERLMSEVLYDLRMRYVEASNT